MADRVMLVINADGLCVNAIVLGNGWSPPQGHTLVAPVGDAWIGWTRSDDGTWAPPADTEPQPDA